MSASLRAPAQNIADDVLIGCNAGVTDSPVLCLRLSALVSGRHRILLMTF